MDQVEIDLALADVARIKTDHGQHDIVLARGRVCGIDALRVGDEGVIAGGVEPDVAQLLQGGMRGTGGVQAREQIFNAVGAGGDEVARLVLVLLVVDLLLEPGRGVDSASS